MRFEDTITIQTPEGVDIELTLAGLGSRFVAGLVDGVIKLTVIIVASIPVSQADGSTLLNAVVVVFVFLVWWGYDVLFEVFASGRTPGKRWNGIRVVRIGGQPVGFLTSAIRNIIRIVDVFLFGIGMVAIVVTSKNQRLGDLAAGTLVVRELRVRRKAPVSESFAARDELVAWDVGAVTTEEIRAVRHFLQRRADLGDEARNRLADQFAAAHKPKVAGPVDDLGSETFLEQLVKAKSSR